MAGGGMSGGVFAHEIDEALVDAAVGGELGVKGGGEDVSLLDEDREAVALGENFDSCAGLHDARRSDVDELHGATFETGVDGFDDAIDLASVGVALHRCVEHAEALLGGMRDFLGQEDAAGAGAEGGLAADEGFERGEKSVTFEKFEEGGRFAAGNDEAIERIELPGLADEHGLGAGFTQGCSVRVEVALDGEDSDAWLRFGHCGWVGISQQFPK